jgi:hypothetical protein
MLMVYRIAMIEIIGGCAPFADPCCSLSTEAATRLMFRASLLNPPVTEPEHFLMAKHLSRIAHGKQGRARL